MALRLYIIPLLALLLVAGTGSARATDYALLYRAVISPDSEVARVEIRLRGERLPRKLVLHLNPDRHLALRSDAGLTLEGDTATWKPQGPDASLHYEFVISEKKASGRYDSLLAGTGPSCAVTSSFPRSPPLSPRASLPALNSSSSCPPAGPRPRPTPVPARAATTTGSSTPGVACRGRKAG